MEKFKKVIDIISIMPDFFGSFLKAGLIARAINDGIMEINILNPRSFSSDKHSRVDGRIYGGGAGQLLMAEPIVKAYEYSLNKFAEYSEGRKTTVIIMSPSGRILNSSISKDISSFDHIIIICGRYEGIDARVAEITGAIEISIGDYILSGGEIASIVLIEAVSRYFEGFLGNSESLAEESLSGTMGNTLEYPQYTRPRIIKGLKVPDILTEGNHKEIIKWKSENSLRKTAINRPELISDNRR